MYSLTSATSRIDAVPATPEQLKMQLPRAAADDKTNTRVQTANRQEQNVRQDVNQGDPGRTEAVLAASRATVQKVEYNVPVVPISKTRGEQPQTAGYGRISTYA